LLLIDLAAVVFDSMRDDYNDTFQIFNFYFYWKIKNGKIKNGKIKNGK